MSDYEYGHQTYYKGMTPPENASLSVWRGWYAAQRENMEEQANDLGD